MRLTPLPVHPALVGLVERAWLFESAHGLPNDDQRLIVPDGSVKVLIPLVNHLTAVSDTTTTERRAGQIHVAGVSERAVQIAAERGVTRTVGLNFRAGAASRLLALPMTELGDRILTLEELWGRDGRDLTARIFSCASPSDAAVIIQEALHRRLDRSRQELSIVDHAVRAIERSRGQVEVRMLGEETGYSARYLNVLFAHHVGLGPKRLASVVRFQHFYRLWGEHGAPDFYRGALHGHYHDQAHFIREFRRYSGSSPARFAERGNEFGRLFVQNNGAAIAAAARAELRAEARSMRGDRVAR